MSLKLELLLAEIEGEILTGNSDLQKIQVTGGYASDLLSDVMGNSREGDAWITIMRHLNVIAVASMVGLPVIIFARNTEPEKTIIEKAEAEGICLISSPLSSFEISGKLYILLNQK
jgi:serine kinase of HPr protein (carbohydrate metabolism regulator)